MLQQHIILVGPTASGKSARAMELARAHKGSIINADAMQIYAGLPLLTAQPAPQDRAEIPHLLYEVTDAVEASSAGKWLAQAQTAIQQVLAEGRTPILVGGTGLYFEALRGGLAHIPAIPDAVRTKVENLYAEWGEEKFRTELAKYDAHSAARIARNDRQRLIRAYEVAIHTGKPLGEWHKRSSPPPPLAGGGWGVGAFHKNENLGTPLDLMPPPPTPAREGRGSQYNHANFKFETHLLLPPREELYANCDKRFLAMIDQGAIDEVKKLLARNLSTSLPAMKIIGVREIAGYLNGEMNRDDAIAKAQQMTRNYAKRQMTWFRNQWKD
jgi:tRNA dimethylallyltransferase